MADDPRFFLVDAEGQPWTLGVDPLTIGASDENKLVIDAPDVSLWHARVWRSRGRCWIADEGTPGGTRVGGRRIAGQRELQPGDVVEIGPARLVLRFGRGEPPPAPPPGDTESRPAQTRSRSAYPVPVQGEGTARDADAREPAGPEPVGGATPGDDADLPPVPGWIGPAGRERGQAAPRGDASQNLAQAGGTDRDEPDAAPGQAAAPPARQRGTVRPLRIVLGFVILAAVVVTLALVLRRDGSLDVAMQQATSDAEGIARFQHPTTGQEISVLVTDEYSSPSEGQTLLYLPGSERPFLAFFSFRDGELDSVEFALSPDYLQFMSFCNKLFPTGPDQHLAIAWFLEEAGFGTGAYQRTIDAAEYAPEGSGEAEVQLVLHEGGELYYGVMGMELCAPPLIGEAARPNSGRWDWYELALRDTGSGRRIPFSIYLQSQPPRVENVVLADLGGGQVAVQMTASDPVAYDAWPGRGYPLPDATVAGGPSPASDLTWRYRVVDGAGAVYRDWATYRQTAACRADGCEAASVDLERMEPGAYMLEVFATDEAGNESQTVQYRFEAGG